MNWKHVAGIVGLVVLVVLIGLGIREYINAREDRIRAEEQAKAADQRMKDREVQYQQQLSTLLKQRAAVRTPQQAVAAIPDVSHLPVAIRIVQPPDLLPNAPSAAKVGDAIIPQESVVPLFQQLADCRVNELGLTKCQGDLADVRQQATAWEKAAKGGSWMKRTLRKAKVIACAGAGAGLGAAANQGPKGAAIGALGGATLCSLF